MENKHSIAIRIDFAVEKLATEIMQGDNNTPCTLQSSCHTKEDCVCFQIAAEHARKIIEARIEKVLENDKLT